jgi:hypothetical protein
MIVLNSTTDKIQVVNGVTASPELQIFSSWRDRTSTTFIAGNSQSITSGTTTVDAITGPADSSTQRIIDYISIYNPDTNSTANITIQLNSSSTNFTLFRGNLSPGDTLAFNEGNGFSTISGIGSVKTSEFGIAPDSLGSELNACVLTQNYTSPIGALNRLDSSTDLPLYIPFGNNNGTPGSTGNAMYWFRSYLPFVISTVATGSTLGLGIVPTINFSNMAIRATNFSAYGGSNFRYGMFFQPPKAAPTDSASQLFSNFQNEVTAFSGNGNTAAPISIVNVVDSYFGPPPLGESNSNYGQIRFNVGNNSGIISGGTGFGIAQDGGILYFRKCQKNL